MPQLGEEIHSSVSPMRFEHHVPEHVSSDVPASLNPRTYLLDNPRQNKLIKVLTRRPLLKQHLITRTLLNLLPLSSRPNIARKRRTSLRRRPLRNHPSFLLHNTQRPLQILNPRRHITNRRLPRPPHNLPRLRITARIPTPQTLRTRQLLIALDFSSVADDARSFDPWSRC